MENHCNWKETINIKFEKEKRKRIMKREKRKRTTIKRNEMKIKCVYYYCYCFIVMIFIAKYWTVSNSKHKKSEENNEKVANRSTAEKQPTQILKKNITVYWNTKNIEENNMKHTNFEQKEAHLPTVSNSEIQTLNKIIQKK